MAAVLLLVLLLVQWLWGDTLVTFTGELLQGLGALPTWLVNVVVVGTRVLAVIVLVGGLVMAVRDGGGRMLAHLGAGGRHRRRAGHPARGSTSSIRSSGQTSRRRRWRPASRPRSGSGRSPRR